VLDNDDMEETEKRPYNYQRHLMNESGNTLSPVIKMMHSPCDQTENGGTVECAVVSSGENYNKSRDSPNYMIRSSSKNETMNECEEHRKKIEAFCSECNETLCIDCILSDKHKQHSFTSLEKAAMKQKEMIETNISKVESTRKTLEKMDARIDKYIKDLDERVETNTKSIEDIYNLVLITITKKKQDYLTNMTEVKEREQKIVHEKKNKITCHIQSIDQFLNIQDKIESISDSEILNASKQRDETLKLATKNAVDYTFTLSVLPELKKDVEITNFGKQLKNAMRDFDAANPSKSIKQKKLSSKKIPKTNMAKTGKKGDVKEVPKVQAIKNNCPEDILNESNITDMSTPVCISAKTHFFEHKKPKQVSVPEQPRVSKLAKKDNELPPQPNTITTQVLNSRNMKLGVKPNDNIKQGASSFSYQPLKGIEKLNTSDNTKPKNESIGMFNQLLESTQLRQKDRQKRYRQNLLNKHPQNEASKDVDGIIANKIEETKEAKEQENELVKQPTSLTNVDSEDAGSSHAEDRAHRSYLRSTKTSRMKSVNRRDQHIKDSAKNEGITKPENALTKKGARDTLPPTAPPQHSSSVNVQSFKNYNRLKSPRARVVDDPPRIPNHNASQVQSDIFKLENKIKNFSIRRGSKTKNDQSEAYITSLDDRRAERKNLKPNQNISKIPSVKNIERNEEAKEPRVNQWEQRFGKGTKNKMHNTIGENDSQGLFQNVRKKLDSSDINMLDQNNDSPKYTRRYGSKKNLDKSPQDVLA